MSVQHPTLGVLRDYDLVSSLGQPLEPGRTYEIVLDSGQVTSTTVADWSTLQSLNLTVTPSDADVFINGVPQRLVNGATSMRLPIGDVKVRVSKPLYETYEATVTLTRDLPEDLDIRLADNFGYLMFAETPEYQGAEVRIDGKVIGTLPLREVKVEGGRHELLVTKPLYSPYKETVNVVRNNARRVEPKLAANFANVTIQAPEGCEILIDGNPRGFGLWEGRLDPGSYTAEALLPNHTPSRLEFSVENGSSKTVTLPSPLPINGALEVMTVPGGSTIILDDQPLGQSGQTFNDILIGEHTLRIYNPGHKPVDTVVKVEEGRVTRQSFILDSSCDITVSSIPEGALLSIDGEDKGVTPLPIHTNAGEYSLRLEKDRYYPYRKKFNLDGSSTDLEIRLKRKYFNETYLSLGFDPVGPGGFTVSLGTYIDDFHINVWTTPLMAQTKSVAWNSTSPETPPALAEYKPFAAGVRLGYGISFLNKALRLTPMVGVAITRLTERNLRPVDGFSSSLATAPIANGANVLSATVGAKLRYRVWKFIGVSVTPEYRIGVLESDGFRTLRESVPDSFKKYAGGFGLDIAVEFSF